MAGLLSLGRYALGESRELALPEFPGVTFAWTPDSVTARDASGDRGEYDYVLTGADGSLQVTKSAYRGAAVSTGTLALVRGGRLEIARERQISP